MLDDKYLTGVHFPGVEEEAAKVIRKHGWDLRDLQSFRKLHDISPGSPSSTLSNSRGQSGADSGVSDS